MCSGFNPQALQQKARELRCDVIRMITEAGSGHPGGSLSAVEIITYLYFYRMRVRADVPSWVDRDRFVLSKGHACPTLYAALAHRGYFPRDILWTLRDSASMLQGHPDMTKTPGIDMTTGSLGQGFSCALGIALGGKLQKRGYRVYALLGDGELQSGQVWEAAMAAAHYRLDNLIAVIDDNKLQLDGPVAAVMNVEPLLDKWKAFGWDALEIDGHDFREIHAGFEKCLRLEGKPHLLVAHTVKGKGVVEMEGEVGWHGMAPTREQAEAFIAEIMGK